MGALGKLNKSVQGAANKKAIDQGGQVAQGVGQVGGQVVAQAQQESNVPGNAQALTQGGGPGGQKVDPKLQKAADDYQTVMMQVLHAKETRGGVMNMLKSAPPEQSIPAAAMQINDMVEKKVEAKKGSPVEAAVKISGAVYLVQDLSEMGNQGGLFQLTEEEVGFVLEETMKQYIHRGINDGSIDPVELQQAIEPMMNDTQNEVGGMIAKEAGLPIKPTAKMGMNKAVQNKTAPLEKENKQLKGQLKMTQQQGQPQPQPQGQPQQGQPQGVV